MNFDDLKLCKFLLINSIKFFLLAIIKYLLNFEKLKNFFIFILNFIKHWIIIGISLKPDSNIVEELNAITKSDFKIRSWALSSDYQFAIFW